MAGIVDQYQQAFFTDPQNGQTPVDANQVTANDNNLRVKFNSHDADPTIHVQSIIEASLPAAGVAQRVFITTDTLRLVIDNGASWDELDYLNLTTGGTVVGATTFSGGIIGNVTGNLTGNVTGDVSGTAAAWATGRTITLTGDVAGTSGAFDGSGNLSFATSIGAGTVTNAMLAGSIADTNLNTISTAGKVANSATTATSTNTNSAIVARDSSGNFAAHTVTLSGDINIHGVTYTWPATAGSNGYVLSTDGAGVLSWQPASAGFVTGSGTGFHIPYWSGTSALSNTTLTTDGNYLAVGTQQAHSGNLRLSSGQTVMIRNNGNSADLTMLTADASDYIQVGDTTGKVKIGGYGYASIVSGFVFPTADGSAGQVLKTDGAKTLSFVTPGGFTGSGTTDTIPLFSGSTALGDSLLAQSGSTVTMTGAFTITGNLSVQGNTTIGDASTDTLTILAGVASDIIPSADATYALGTSAKQFTNLFLKSAGVVKVGNVQVLAARNTGWSPTWDSILSADKTHAFIHGSVSTDQLAQLCRAFYDAMVAHGLIGT